MTLSLHLWTLVYGMGPELALSTRSWIHFLGIALIPAPVYWALTQSSLNDMAARTEVGTDRYYWFSEGACDASSSFSTPTESNRLTIFETMFWFTQVLIQATVLLSWKMWEHHFGMYKLSLNFLCVLTRCQETVQELFVIFLLFNFSSFLFTSKTVDEWLLLSYYPHLCHFKKMQMFCN